MVNSLSKDPGFARKIFAAEPGMGLRGSAFSLFWNDGREAINSRPNEGLDLN